jgi:radical SAM protein with 4Fe4S-binding SPASM domain
MDGSFSNCGSTQEFLNQFRKRVAKERIPLSGSIDLTHRCNLRCIHCYLDPQGKKKHSIQEEMDTEQVMRVLDEITAAGCLYLLITGGEPLLRRDFQPIYRRAKENGLLVTIFTNGTLVSNEIVELFADLPPKAIEISLYGASAETYEGITAVKGSYEKCMAGIHRLLDQGLNLRLKTILMTVNQHEFYEMEQMAKDFGVPFRFDTAIFPRFNGDLSPIKLRISPEEAIEKEFSEPERSKEWKNFYDHFKEIPPSNHIYECGAGLTYFHIDASGNLRPCLMSHAIQYSILSGDFITGWQGKMPAVRKNKMNPDHVCHNCPKRSLCGYCPPFFELEGGSETVISDFLCSMGQLRYERLQSMPDRRET